MAEWIWWMLGAAALVAAIVVAIAVASARDSGLRERDEEDEKP